MNKGKVRLGLRSQSYERIMQYVYDAREMAMAGIMGQVDAVETLQNVVEKLNQFGTLLKEEVVLIPESADLPVRRGTLNCRCIKKGETHGQIQARLTADSEH